MKYTTPENLSRTNPYCLRSILIGQEAYFDYYFTAKNLSEAEEYFTGQVNYYTSIGYLIEASLYAYFIGTETKLVTSTNPVIIRQSNRRNKRSEARYNKEA